ncbi:ATP-grasp domain-containing protein [Prolixibacter sp. SD074]|uniref:ATP-grasp domain-containing protein n=1 Tax=Prolixibacter sp. SD074 TaxID=2652391 RepID=UPI00127EF771|nr:ATP-grasp domain-containing protein [Prolixibacter sp. SD074]GET30894.1 ATP-grasp domain-containing protein [Prolixibacter sp. SD074]
MILLEGPYVSDFLKQTIKNYRIPVVYTSFSAKILDEKEHQLISTADAVKRVERNPEQLIYTNSENSIHWVEQNLPFSGFPEKINMFKNKVRFRKLLRDKYPEYFFKGIPFHELSTTDVSGFTFPFIIKPAVGFFSMGVYKVDKPEEWPDIVARITEEVAKVQNLYPKEVFDSTEFIAEECIDGTEYAIDCYYNADGKPVILNIMKHLFSSDKDMSDRVYITSKEIILSNLDSMGDFLKEMGVSAGVKNFAAHVEVRINDDGHIVPIEVNPMRFGGWCTTPDLAWYAHGFNIYEYFLSQKEPDWNQLLANKDGQVFSVVVLDNSTGREGKQIPEFDYDRLMRNFEKPLELRKVDYRSYPLFGFVFAQTRSDQMDELTRILKSDLSEYILN